jgi:hypothetical protein
MCALHAARAVDPPDWLIGGGVIRDLVWDHLHGFARPTPPKDVDMVFFDPISLGSDSEQSLLEAVIAKAPDIPWDLKNQAAVHLWYPEVFGVEVEPLTSLGRRGGYMAGDGDCGGAQVASRRHH